MHILTHNSLHIEGDDTWVWKDVEGEKYTVKSAYTKLHNTFIGEHSDMFKLFWSIRALPSAQYFAWRTILNRVATEDNIRRRGTTLQDTLCALCGLEEETVSHLFFTCNIANKVWNMCNRWVGVSTTHHNQSCVHFQNFFMLHFNNKRNNLWKGLWISVICNIWSHRNRVVFRQGKVDWCRGNFHYGAIESVNMDEIQISYCEVLVRRMALMSNWVH